MEHLKLDRKRSYGTVYGDPHVGFVQDGSSFRPDGTLLHAAADAYVETAPTLSAASLPLPMDAADHPVLPDCRPGEVSIQAEVPKAEPESFHSPSPARSEAVRRAWVERRERERAAPVDTGASTEA